LNKACSTHGRREYWKRNIFTLKGDYTWEIQVWIWGKY